MQTQTVSIRELRDNLAQLIEEVAIAKKNIEVTKFGKTKAVIVPYKKQRKPKQKVNWALLPAFGIWRERNEIKDSAKWVKELRERESFRLYK